ncbi:putative PEP-binding protein [Celeribacter halophilus]|uniref:Pyruvate, phosphate dikinase n=1 Tax=Celeribacter halophilus TaxID=576117 RepID=A0A1I3N139_9RHOB|nr:putative PEP-binding protein [Celeribacter halophilus]PZX15607.1 pyruvate,orthophosphate dikinase [Celeribacter halophilus]SFJ02911.1 pyruvate, orthophosphate dikinase [Celeribacter halophilus]
MQQESDILGFTRIRRVAPIAVNTHGGRAKCLQRLIRLDLPVPETVALSFDAVHHLAEGQKFDKQALLRVFGDAPLLSVRPSSEDPDWGGPGAILNIGMNDARHAELTASHGAEAADALYLRFVQSFAVHVERLDPELFEFDASTPVSEALKSALEAHEDETGEPFPQDAAEQLGQVLRSMARAWEGTTARLLRQAKGAPADAGLGLIVQAMALGVGPGESGAGVIQLVDSDTGAPLIKGRYKRQSQGREAVSGEVDALYLTRDTRGPSLEEAQPEIFATLVEISKKCRTRLREEMQVEFTIENGKLSILDAVRVPRSSRAALRIAVQLAEDGIIPRTEAITRVPARSLTELLHQQVDPSAKRDVIAQGIAASPGGAVGRIVFNSSVAQSYQSRGDPCILVRRETTPEDIRGMHSSVGILTERGGVTSHAAVIARGMGVPCVVGASMRINSRERTLELADGRKLQEGDLLTLDGSAGVALLGAVDMLPPVKDHWYLKLMEWADAIRDIGVRANADTPMDAALARDFKAEGIGLCRTEHMFFEGDRLTVMREMIFASRHEDRAEAIARLLPMQRSDFIELFRIMEGLPVCIRLFDPPLHEFLPSDREGAKELAEALDLPLSDVTRRIEWLSEFNPMLGMRGVRLGITFPEIYEMQARAIFEATIEANKHGAPVVPEIMIPLVSAKREVELVKTQIDGVAAAVRTENGAEFTYRLGVMVETPRAALRAGDIAQNAAFLSFGTNDLTQMAYGLSRDDAGRFMNAYVQQGVFPEDPFHMLDFEGVGELLKIGAERGRLARPDVTVAVCGEHGGNPESIAFCREAGFDYVSCSPFRVPVARLAAAQLVVADVK